MHSRAGQIVLFLLLAAAVAPSPAGLAAQEAPPEDARFTARDAHQGVTIAARPPVDAAEAEALFGKGAAPVRAGLLAVEMLIINDRGESIFINLGRITLLRNGDKFEPVSPAEAALLLYPPPEGRSPNLGPQPIPLPRRSPLPKDKKRAEREEAEAALRSRRFRTHTVPPAGRARGFLYFDLGETDAELTRMQLYIPEVNDAETNDGLLFFEIALAPLPKP